MGTSDVLKVLKIARAVGECNLKNFQYITSGHKSRNARAVHAIFLFIIFSTKSLRIATFHALGAHYLKLFSVFQNARTFCLKRNYNNCDRQNKPKIVFLVFQKFYSSLNFRRVQYGNPVLHSITYLCFVINQSETRYFIE